MSWPAAVGGVWPMAAGAAVAPAQDANAVMAQYTPEQWAAWQQWNQWQQQYAQWQSQYGEKYAALQAMQGAAPPLPAAAPSQPAPPPPDKPPPPPHENNQPLFQHGIAPVAPVPPVSNARPQAGRANQQDNRGQTQRGWESDRGRADWNHGGSKWNPNQQPDWQPPHAANWSNSSIQQHSMNKDWNNANEGRQQPSQKQTPAVEVNAEALRRLAEEERLFDVQFQKWEEEFEKWKQQNINHPDKKAYAEYEERFTTCRAQLLERRQQMQQKRIKLTSKPPVEPVLPPQPAHNQFSKTAEMAEQYAKAAAQYAQSASQRRDERGQDLPGTPDFLSSGEQRKGIPGLDLVGEESVRPVEEVPVIDITDERQPKNNQDFTALSKGINNILGDEKILNMLSMVQKVQPKANAAISPQNNVQPQGNNYSPGLRFGPNDWPNQNKPSNFQNQNAGSVFNQQGQINSQYQNSGPKGPGLPPQSNSGPQRGSGLLPYPGPVQPPSQSQPHYGSQQLPPNNFTQGSNYPSAMSGRLDTMQPPPGDYRQQQQNYNRAPPGAQNDFPAPDSRGQDAGMIPRMRPLMGQIDSSNPEMGMRRNPADMQSRGFGAVGPQNRMEPTGPHGQIQYGPKLGGGIPSLMATPMSAPVDMNRPPSVMPEPAELKPKWLEEPILEPTVIVDYDHKPLRVKVRDFIEPVQTFDYNHQSKDKDANRDLPPLDRYSELDVYNQRSGTRVIDYQNKSAVDSSDVGRRDREYPDRRVEGRRERYEERRRDDRRRDEDRRRDDRSRYERHRSPERGRERGEWTRDRERGDWPRDRERGDWHRDRERNRDSPRDPPADSLRASKALDKRDSPAPVAPVAATVAPTNPIVMIDDLLEPPGRDIRPEKIVIILRGIPGSGKSYLAKLIKEREIQNGGSAPRILSMDDYFIQEAEIEERDPATGKMVKKPSMKYVYDERQEENYLNSLIRAYRRTITDQFFPFIIVDANNDQLKNLADLWNYGRQNGFQVYTCTLECDAQTAFKRNVHGRTLDDIQVIAARFSVTPKNYVVLDAMSLLQGAGIQEVTMEDAEDDVVMEDATPEHEDTEVTSKWERMEDSDQLARLDGISKPLRPSQLSLDEYLQLDDWQPQRSAQPGKKMVRWADLEERREQDKLRAIGFVVGQTDWGRMTDPTLGHAALAQTKYIERTARRK